MINVTESDVRYAFISSSDPKVACYANDINTTRLVTQHINIVNEHPNRVQMAGAAAGRKVSKNQMSGVKSLLGAQDNLLVAILGYSASTTSTVGAVTGSETFEIGGKYAGHAVAAGDDINTLRTASRATDVGKLKRIGAKGSLYSLGLSLLGDLFEDQQVKCATAVGGLVADSVVCKASIGAAGISGGAATPIAIINCSSILLTAYDAYLSCGEVKEWFWEKWE